MVVDSVLADFQKLQDKKSRSFNLRDILDTFTAAARPRALFGAPSPQPPREDRAPQFWLFIPPFSKRKLHQGFVISGGSLCLAGFVITDREVCND